MRATLHGAAAERPADAASLRLPMARARSLLIPLLLAAGFALLVLIPYLVGDRAAPAGYGFRGTLWTADDESIYLSAVRQGLHGSWLWRDAFMVATPPRILIYPVYLAAGQAGAALGLSLGPAYALLHAGTALLLAVALWLLSAPYLQGRDRGWFVAFALGTSGAYWLDALLAAGGRAPVPLAALSSPQLSGLTMALFDAHRALGVAGQCAALGGLLGALDAAGAASRRRHALYGAAGLVLLALTLPMLLPLAYGVIALYTLGRVLSLRRGERRIVRAARIASAAVAVVLPSLPFALYYYVVFGHGVWATAALKRIYPPPAFEPVLVIGVLLPLALWGWRAASDRARPLANLLALWCLCALIGRMLPFWQSIRLTDGLSVTIGSLFALGVANRLSAPRARRRVFALASLGALTQYLFLLLLLAQGHATHLYATPAERQALDWLRARTTARDVVLAPYTFSNMVPAAAPCRVVIGHPQNTLDMDLRYPQVRAFFDPATAPAQRARALRATAATLVVYDRADLLEGTHDPRALPELRMVFSAGGLEIFRVAAAR